MRNTRGIPATAHVLLAALIFGAAVCVGMPARAEGGSFAVPADVAPVTSLFDRVAAGFPGQILKVDLVRSRQLAADWVYEVKVLSPAGDVTKLSYDARTLALNEVLGSGYADAGADTDEIKTEARDADAEPERDTDKGSDGGDGGD